MKLSSPMIYAIKQVTIFKKTYNNIMFTNIVAKVVTDEILFPMIYDIKQVTIFLNKTY